MQSRLIAAKEGTLREGRVLAELSPQMDVWLFAECWFVGSFQVWAEIHTRAPSQLASPSRYKQHMSVPR